MRLWDKVKYCVALRKESVDRNNGRLRAIQNTKMSLSARRAWIEIWSAVLTELLILVALRKESVDRNYAANAVDQILPVALRKESVDRNPYIPLAKVRHCEVALRKESVDRNVHTHIVYIAFGVVALRKESVDRNLRLVHMLECSIRSLSARRAWIEIHCPR